VYHIKSPSMPRVFDMVVYGFEPIGINSLRLFMFS